MLLEGRPNLLSFCVKIKMCWIELRFSYFLLLFFRFYSLREIWVRNLPTKLLDKKDDDDDERGKLYVFAPHLTTLN